MEVYFIQIELEGLHRISKSRSQKLRELFNNNKMMTNRNLLKGNINPNKVRTTSTRTNYSTY